MADREEGLGPVALLRSVPLFADLEEGELERFSRVAVARSFPAGTRVFHEGDHSDACYIVRDGNFRVTREHSDGRAITLASLGPGDIFGELAMLDGEVRSASVEALSDGELLALPAGEVRALLARHPEITVKLIAALVRRLRTANERISRQSFQTVPSRVAGVLSQLVAEESPGYSVSELTRFAWRLMRDRLDLFHATHYVVPPLARTKAVVTIHDIIHVLYPQFLPNRLALLYARAMIRRALRRSDRIITVSYNSKRDLVDYFGITPSRIQVIYNGVAGMFRPDVSRAERERVAAKYSLPRPYLLFLGGEKPHKNVRNVLRAFAEANRRQELPHALVLAGPMPPNRSRVEALISALELGPRVCRPGIVPDEDLPGLFAGADVFLYPTLYEGFGLPVVEAMACGVPVLTSATSALQEVAGGYAYLCDPMDVDAIARGVVELATDPARRAEFAQLGIRRAGDFSWDHAAQQTLEVYASALGGP